MPIHNTLSASEECRSPSDRNRWLPTDLQPQSAVCQLFDNALLEARPYQRRIVTTATEMFSGRWRTSDGTVPPPASSVLIESPTGSGKTIMGLAIAAVLQRATGCRVGWVAMRRNLLAQVAKENADRRIGLQMNTISMFDKHPPEVDLLVVDEAQHDGATSMANMHSVIQPRWTLGLSATPYRTDRIKLCFDRVIRDAGIAQLISEGYLSPYHHYTIPRYTPESVAQLLTNEPARWGKSLVFFHRREQCFACANLLCDAGIRCEVVTASTNRERQLSEFQSGKTDVLINMAVLTEGFDCPELKTVFCRPSGKGCTIQMAGRVLRKFEPLPYKQVVQCRKTAYPMLKTAMAAEQYVWTDAGWRGITVNRQLEQITMQSRAIVARTSVELPKLVSANRTRKVSWRRRANDGI